MTKKKVSCLPCRLKKVKCDGEYPCNRCQAKDQNCIYQKPKIVGRPPKNAVINKLVLSRTANSTFDTTAKTQCREFIFENVSNSPNLAAIRYLDDSRHHGLQFHVNQLFSSMFYLNRFAHSSLIPVDRPIDFFAVAPKIKLCSMTNFFTMLSSDIANVLARRVSHLPLAYYDDLAFSEYGLKYDHTPAFFETPSDTALVSNPLNSLPPQQAVRLIDCFFSIHPYSVLFSKTMLLQSYWTDTADPLLMSVIYGTTVYKSQLLDGKPLVLWEAIEKKRRNPFLDYAYILLSKASAEATPSRYQAVVLLALFEVLFGYPRRGMALFSLAHLLASKLGLYDNNLPSGLNAVEKELLSITFWASFNCAIRGCVELQRLPESSLVDHIQPYPPPNIKTSKAYQFDLENNHARSYEHYGHHVETFYVKSVISRVTCKLISHLPDAYVSVASSANSKIQVILSAEESEAKNTKIQENLHRQLANFQAFIKANKKHWSPLQVFTCELYHSFYVICLSFLSDSSAGNLDKPGSLDLTDLDNVIKINQLVPEAIRLVERCFNFVSEAKNYYNETDFLPKGIMINGLDAAVQILMHSYDLVQSDKVRHYIQLVKIILGLSHIWDNWATADLIKSLISQFLEQHPVMEEPDEDTTISSDSSSSTSAYQSPFSDMFENNNNTTTILQNDTLLFPLLQQPSSFVFPETMLSVYNGNLDFMNSPWLTGNEQWLQDLHTTLFTEPVVPQQEQNNQYQLEFNNIFDNLM